MAKPKVRVQTRRLNERTCPHCNTVHDACTGIGDDELLIPCEGDLTICMYCGTALKFSTQHGFVFCSQADWETVTEPYRQAAEAAARKPVRFSI